MNKLPSDRRDLLDEITIASVLHFFFRRESWIVETIAGSFHSVLNQLKVKLQTSCSPLLKDLTRYLLEIFKNYKVEVKEFLASDPILLQEIEYNARQDTA